MAATVTSASVEETVALGRVLGAALVAGDVVVLTGDLGAGKTHLTKGIAVGMGVCGDVTSPTFTIGMVYEGTKLPLYHFDLYRLERADQLEDTGLFDVLGGDGPCVIEWGERFVGELGDERLDVFITRDGWQAPGLGATPTDGDGEPPRRIELVPHGVRAEELCALVQNNRVVMY